MDTIEMRSIDLGELKPGMHTTAGTRSLDKEFGNPSECETSAREEDADEEVTEIIHNFCREAGRFVAVEESLIREKLLEQIKELTRVTAENAVIEKQNATRGGILSKIGLREKCIEFKQVPEFSGFSFSESLNDKTGKSPLREVLLKMVEDGYLEIAGETNQITVFAPTKKMFYKPKEDESSQGYGSRVLFTPFVG